MPAGKFVNETIPDSGTRPDFKAITVFFVRDAIRTDDIKRRGLGTPLKVH